MSFRSTEYIHPFYKAAATEGPVATWRPLYIHDVYKLEEVAAGYP